MVFSPGILDERMHIFVATGLTAGPTRLEFGEQIETQITPLAEAIAMIERGEVEDAKTMAAYCSWIGGAARRRDATRECNRDNRRDLSPVPPTNRIRRRSNRLECRPTARPIEHPPH